MPPETQDPCPPLIVSTEQQGLPFWQPERQRQRHSQPQQHLADPCPAFYQQTSNEILKLKLTLAVQRLMASHIALKILAVFVVAAPIVYLGGVLYSLITGAPIQLGLLKVYSVIIRVPGAKVTEEKSLAAFLLMNFFFLVGLFSFAVLIGIVSEEIKTQVKDVRGGNYSVITQGHTLVLNWNRQSMPLLRKIAEDSHGCTRTLGRELVILSEEPKDRMDVEIAKSRQIAKSGIKVVTREGAPHCVRDLESVSAGSARTVILLHPENAKDGDTKKAAAVLGLEVARNDLAAPPQQQQQQAKHGQQTQQQQVILQRIPGDPGQVRLFSLVNGTVSSGRDMALVEVNGNRSLARLIAQSAVQPGVANIYSSIAESLPGVPDFQLRTCGVELEGRSYQEARRSYKSAVVCGYVSHADGATHLNPRDGDVLHAADRLILLAHPGGVPARSAAAAAGGASATTDLTALQGQLQGATNSPSRPKKVVVLGWRGGIADLAAAIEEFASPGSEVVFVSRWSYPDLPANSRNCSFSYLEGSPFDHDACRRAGVGNCNSIIIGKRIQEIPEIAGCTLDCEGGDAKAADARSMASLLVVQDIVSAAAAVKAPDTPPHVVAAIHRIGTVRTAKHILKGLGPGCLTAELLTPNEIVSSQLLQVANEPGLAPALAELIDNSPGSQGIYLRKPECFNLDGARLVPFAEVVELARLRGETALGHVAGDGTLALSPGAAAAHLYGGRGSRVVVLASR
ncbi:hypothetical protein N2152v2_009327 [Parachlorella kessleri]